MSSKSKSKTGNSPSKSKKKYLELPVIVEPAIEPWVRKTWNRRHHILNKIEFSSEIRCRCRICKLVFNKIEDFLIHSCWRKYFQLQVDFIDHRLIRCPRCRCLFYAHEDYLSHPCITLGDCAGDTPEAEQVYVLDKWQHLDFYIEWRINVKKESGKWFKDIIAICSKCNTIFYSKISFLLHSCAQNPSTLKFWICNLCKIVFWSYKERLKHYHEDTKHDHRDENKVPLEITYPCLLITTMTDFMNGHMKKERWETDKWERLMKLLSRLKDNCELSENELEGENSHCVFFNPSEKIACSKCWVCSSTFCDIESFLLHPCVAGHLLDPTAMHLALRCNECSHLFVRYDWFVAHRHSCRAEKISFVRMTTDDEVKIFLRRWHKELWLTRNLPPRPALFRCSECYEQFRELLKLFQHNNKYHKKIKISPNRLNETIWCSGCNELFYTTVKAFEHKKLCSASCNPELVRISYKMEEVLEGLRLWRNLPKIMDVDMTNLLETYLQIIYDL